MLAELLGTAKTLNLSVAGAAETAAPVDPRFTLGVGINALPFPLGRGAALGGTDDSAESIRGPIELRMAVGWVALERLEVGIYASESQGSS